jgi:hypothetical protein
MGPRSGDVHLRPRKLSPHGARVTAGSSRRLIAYLLLREVRPHRRASACPRKGDLTGTDGPASEQSALACPSPHSPYTHPVSPNALFPPPFRTTKPRPGGRPTASSSFRLASNSRTKTLSSSTSSSRITTAMSSRSSSPTSAWVPARRSSYTTAGAARRGSSPSSNPTTRSAMSPPAPGLGIRSTCFRCSSPIT